MPLRVLKTLEVSLFHRCLIVLEKNCDANKNFYLISLKITHSHTISMVKPGLKNIFEDIFNPSPQKYDFWATCEFQSDVQTRELLEQTCPCFSLPPTQWRFLIILFLLSPSCWKLLVKQSIYTRSKDSIHLQQKIFPEESNVIRVWNFITTGISILRCRTIANLLPHFRSSMLIGSDWDWGQIIVRIFLFSRQ